MLNASFGSTVGLKQRPFDVAAPRKTDIHRHDDIVWQVPQQQTWWMYFAQRKSRPKAALQFVIIVDYAAINAGFDF
jgi:hypothetical protein